MTATSIRGNRKGEIHHVTTLVFHEHRIQLRSLADGYRSIYLAGAPPSETGRRVAASAHPAQVPLHRTSISGPTGRVAGPAVYIRALRSYGDIIAAILAVLALISRSGGAGAVVAWIFSLWGSADINAFYQANRAGLLPGQLGANYFLPTLVVPLLLITHALAFRILLQNEKVSAVQEGRRLG